MESKTIFAPSFRRVLWLMLGVAVIARLVVAFRTYGLQYDIDSSVLVRMALGTDPLHVYSLVNGGTTVAGAPELDPPAHWPYPPGFFPWLLVASSSGHLGLPFHGTIQVPSILADGAIALLVQHYLGLRGASEAKRLVAAAIVLFGPSLFVVSGYHGQIDSVAILPAVAALVVWEQADDRRALWAGLLIGLGGAMKTAPLLMVLPLLASARSWREAATLVGIAIAVPLVALSPFLLADPSGVLDGLRYRGLPGVGGLSLIAQPTIVVDAFTGSNHGISGLALALYDSSRFLLIAAMACYVTFVVRNRASAVDAAVLVWLTFYVFGSNFFLNYLVWGIPFLLMAGLLWETLLIEALAIVPTLMTYSGSAAESEVVFVYIPLMIGMWIALAVLLVMTARRVAGNGVVA